MVWARVIRGIRSMAKTVSPALASAAISPPERMGSMMPIRIAPLSKSAVSSSLPPIRGRCTLSTSSAPASAAFSPPAILAPAAS
jgi:hypothetical protein